MSQCQNAETVSSQEFVILDGIRNKIANMPTVESSSEPRRPERSIVAAELNQQSNKQAAAVAEAETIMLSAIAVLFSRSPEFARPHFVVSSRT